MVQRPADHATPRDDEPLFVISRAAELAGMHPQTLRQYDRLGLVQPGRAGGGGRRYSERDVALLREVQKLSQEDGVNLAGIKRIIGLEQLVADLQQRVADLEHELNDAYTRIAQLEAMRNPYTGRDLVRQESHSTALVIWRPRRSPDK